jgi:uncharacterized protein YkwD
MFTTRHHTRATTTTTSITRTARRWVLGAGIVAALALGATACLPPASAGPPDSVTAGVLDAMNRDRAANGLGALGWNNQLSGLGAGWAAHLANANGGLVHQNLTDVLYSPGYEGYTTLGENLLVGPDSTNSDQMETAWMASSGHRANILRGNFTTAGVGYAHANARIWVAVEFGG